MFFAVLATLAHFLSPFSVDNTTKKAFKSSEHRMRNSGRRHVRTAWIRRQGKSTGAVQDEACPSSRTTSTRPRRHLRWWQRHDSNNASISSSNGSSSGIETRIPTSRDITHSIASSSFSSSSSSSSSFQQQTTSTALDKDYNGYGEEGSEGSMEQEEELATDLLQYLSRSATGSVGAVSS